MDSYSQIDLANLRTFFIANPYSLGTPLFEEKPYKDGMFSCVLFAVRSCGTRRILGLGIATTAAQARRYAEDAASDDLYRNEGYHKFLDEYEIPLRYIVNTPLPGISVDFIVPTKVDVCYLDTFLNSTTGSFPQ